MAEDQFERATRFALAALGIDFGGSDSFVQQIASNFRKRAGTPLLPKPGESLAVSVLRPKTAALAFDRVFRFPTLIDPIPESAGYYCATMSEIMPQMLIIMMEAAKETGLAVDFNLDEFSSISPQQKAINERKSLTRMFSQQSSQFSLHPTIIYANQSDESDVSKDSKSVLTTALTNLQIVDEEKLSWDQVLEFRKDPDAVAYYRRITRFIDGSIVGRSQAELEDVLSDRLENYEWSIKKHGIRAKLGSISATLDPKFLSATSLVAGSAAIAGGAVWGALAGLTIALGKAAVSFGTARIEGQDELRASNFEIAYVHEVKKRLGRK